MKRRLFPSTTTKIADSASTWHESSAEVQEERQRNKQEILDKAYDEFCRLREAGQSVSPTEFCRQFPTYRKSLRKLIDVHDTLESIPELDEVAWPEPGKVYRGFELLLVLGIGAIARVYLAAERALGGRFVAIKVSQYGDDEADTLGKLSHPNVVPVHSVDVNSETGMTAVCMPFLGGATLASVLDIAFTDDVPPRDAKIILEAAEVSDSLVEFIDRAYVGTDADPLLVDHSYVDGIVHLGIQLAEALAYTHSQGILHRDLKPSNVLLAPNGRPMLLDFNLSCDIQLDVNRVGGTLPYMPPEQIREVHLSQATPNAQNDPRSDIFSLGVILYELLSGRLPFGDPPDDVSPEDAGAAYLEMQQRKPIDLRERNPQVSRKLAETIEQCLAQDLADRPKSATELASLLRRHFAAPQRLQRWSHERQWFLLTAALMILGAISALSVWAAYRAPLHERLCNSAVTALRAGDYEHGLQLANTTLTEKPDSLRARLIRARLYQLTDDYPAACNDFEVLWNKTHEWFFYECRAYCSVRRFDYAEAERLYLHCVGHKATAPLHVNLGFAKLRNNKFKESIGEATNAIRLDPNFRPAYYLRSIASISQLRKTRNSRASNEASLHALMENAIADIDTTIALEDSAKAQITAASIKVSFVEQKPQLRDQIHGHLEQAFEMGVSLEKLDDIPAFKTIADEKWFIDLMDASKRQKNTAPPNTWICVTPPSIVRINACLDGHDLAVKPQPAD